jgi:hypothetical protein
VEDVEKAVDDFVEATIKEALDGLEAADTWTLAYGCGIY